MECADSRHATLCDADSRGFIVVAFCSAILHHWMCKIPTEVATLTQKRWKIEEYHKSIKQNASLAKSPTKTVRSQCNHIFASIVAFCKLETLSVKAQLNHFALKYKLLVRSNQIAFEELRRLKCL
ncbi:hypothetical protein GW536_11575 [Piscirickettsia salmonis]|nr:hypothetical protein GW536_11575 [Piscirickettsia salmonis]